MELDWDPEKTRRNFETHGVSFDAVPLFQWDSAVLQRDDRQDYGETRLVALGLIQARVHVLVYTIRSNKRRVISLRKANKREQNEYARAID